MSQRDRLYIRTLGCPKNEADGAALIRYLEQAGWVVVDDPDDADVEIVNTCGFVEAAKAESIGAIWEGVDRKHAAPNGRRRLLVTGCLAQRYAKELSAEVPALDAIVGFDRPDLVARALDQTANSGSAVCWVEKPGATYREPAVGWSFDESHRAPLSAYIKIGDGCDNACRFCAIPLIRGRQRSRSAAAITNEIRNLVSHGTREVVLVSQDTTSWGRDLENGADLASLLRRIDSIPGEFWIRLMYAHPAFITDPLIEAFGACAGLVPYLDVPLQHASDRLLGIMNRGTTCADTEAKLDRLRKVRPDIALRTTFLVGHPGETDDDFEELMRFAADNAFERMGVFTYSEEEGTPSARLEGKVPENVASERAARLAGLFDTWAAEQSIDKIGSTIPCLLESRDATGSWEGRSVHDAPEIDGRVVVTGGTIEGPGLYRMIVTDAHGVDLTGTLPTPIGSRAPGKSKVGCVL
ncbi:MAG TPA: 30S ribosomal protein S12 methylthiotransferase RimO [Acidobacteriota bacterium]|nr:30S ribosomal protein S12 methylthiotransferase RimO [Acidobacteriota bacterium]